MWLINIQTKLLEDFTVREIPRYAILSHTWTDEEVTFREFLSQDGDTVKKKESKKGFIKIMKTCVLAAQDGIGYVWVDTCCIDKSSSAELTEAINSMWRYYKDAEVCYAYLSDLSQRANVMEELKSCKWFTRGWTLQELIAPKELEFYDKTWNFRGTKDEYAELIYLITKIPPNTLRNTNGLAKLSIAERMTWASKRETSRIEDTAYCLLGIFDINMPLLYGEGNKAFIRLQQEIIKNNNDLSIFGWCPEDREEPFIVPKIGGATNEVCNLHCSNKTSNENDFYSVLAPSPKEFARPSHWDIIQSVEHTVTNRGIKIDCSLSQICLRGCLINFCECCSHCRKYVLVIGGERRHPGRHLDRKFFGIILEKTGPDVFIRSKKQLIYFKPLPHPILMVSKTRHRSIYILTQTPYNSQDLTYQLSLDINQSSKFRLRMFEAMPEAIWDFSKMCWHVQDDDDWVMVGLTTLNQHRGKFYILYNPVRGQVSIKDSSLHAKEIALLSQNTSKLQLLDVLALFRYPIPFEWNSEMDFCIEERAVKLKAKIIRTERRNFLNVWIEDTPAATSSTT